MKVLGASVLGGHPVALIQTDHDTYVTSGLFSTQEFGFELIFNGPAEEMVVSLMMDIVSRVFTKGALLLKNQPDFRFANMPIMFRDCQPALVERHQEFARKIYHCDVPFVQVVFPDHEGVLPGQPGCDPHLFEMQEFFCDII